MLLKVISLPKLVAKRLRADNRYSPEGAEREQVLVARDDRVSLTLNGAGDDHVVVRVAHHTREWPGAAQYFARYLAQAEAKNVNPFVAERVSRPDVVARNQLASYLDDDRGGEYQLESAFRGEGQKLVGKPTSANEGAYENGCVEDSPSHS
jgi:hypothetical protein